MHYRTPDIIFATSGMPAPSVEEVRFEARELLQRKGWGLPLIFALHKIRDPYWREAIARCLMDKWMEMVRNRDEQVFYCDSNGKWCYCWLEAESDFNSVIRQSTNEQAEAEQNSSPSPALPEKEKVVYHPTDIKQQIKELQSTIETMKQNLNQYEMKEPTQVVNHYHGPYIANNYVQDGGHQILSAENVYWNAQAEPQIGSAAKPNPGDYNAVRVYIEERKQQDEPFKKYCNEHTRKQLCERLSEEFGWLVDDHSLGVNINRNI